MIVKRITLDSLQKILHGTINSAQSCVIKLYSNNCHFCQGLREHYEEIAQLYKDYHFFAFNVEDHPNIEKELSVTGVPTILFVNNDNVSHSVTVLQDPPFPDKLSYYTLEQVKNFIESFTDEGEIE
tara:strand:+ start:453 stop:830 length:378 start_codon:yes stop_codon:yes gene_type:complete